MIRFMMALIIASFAVTAHAQYTPGWDFQGYSASGTNGSWDFGANFNATAPVTVSALGFFDQDGDGFLSAHPVALYDSAGNLLASATVTSGDPLVGNFRYAAITPVALGAGSYQVAGVSGADPYAWLSSGLQTAPNIALTGQLWASGTAPAFLAYGGQDDNVYFGPGIAVDVPEPISSLGLLVGGAAMAAIRIRRRKA